MMKGLKKHIYMAGLCLMAACGAAGCTDDREPQSALSGESETEEYLESVGSEDALEELTEAETEPEEIPLTTASIRKAYRLLRREYGEDFLLPMSPSVLPSQEELQQQKEQEIPRLADYPMPELEPSMYVLETQLKKRIADYEGVWSIGVYNLRNGEEVIINDRSMYSASVLKLFIMAAVYDAVARGELERTSELVGTIADMIRYSSNGAANRLVALLGDGDFAAGVEKVNTWLEESGYSRQTRLYNGFQDESLILDPIRHNSTGAADCARLLEQVYHRSFASRRVCNEIEENMLAQETRYKIPAGLPEGTSVGNKSGETDSIENDVAVVYGGVCDYVISVFSNGWPDKETAQIRVKRISSEVYSFFNDPEYIRKRYHPLLQSLKRTAPLPERPAQEEGQES